MIRLRWLAGIGKEDIGADYMREPLAIGEELARRGVTVVADDSFDVSWGHQRQVGSADRPHILHELRDAASINWHARWKGGHDRATLLVKPQNYRDFSLHNEEHFETSLHGVACYYAASPADRPLTVPAPLTPQLPTTLAAKIRLGWNWLFFPGISSLLPLDLGGPRPLDVTFAGTMIYGRWHITWHRQQLWRRLSNLPGRNEFHDKRIFPRPDFHKWLTRSKVVISPWGFGETCIRDIEALLAGCILIKPETSWIETWPEYHHFPNCLYCRPDFSDLDEVVVQALDRWQALRTVCLDTANTLQLCRTPAVLAERICGIVSEALVRGVPTVCENNS